MSSNKRNASRKHEVPIENSGDEREVVVACDKPKVKCICPKCDKRHIMNFHWIGKGKPRKYCQNWRDSMQERTFYHLKMRNSAHFRQCSS